MILMLLPALLQVIPSDSGEVHLRNIRQLTFGGQNAEAYFSRSGRELIFQRQEADSGCDQEFVMNVDGTGLHRVSNGRGRTTCGYFFDSDRRIFYASTQSGKRCSCSVETRLATTDSTRRSSRGPRESGRNTWPNRPA